MSAVAVDLLGYRYTAHLVRRGRLQNGRLQQKLVVFRERGVEWIGILFLMLGTRGKASVVYISGLPFGITSQIVS